MCRCKFTNCTFLNLKTRENTTKNKQPANTQMKVKHKPNKTNEKLCFFSITLDCTQCNSYRIDIIYYMENSDYISIHHHTHIPPSNFTKLNECASQRHAIWICNKFAYILLTFRVVMYRCVPEKFWRLFSRLRCVHLSYLLTHSPSSCLFICVRFRLLITNLPPKSKHI